MGEDSIESKALDVAELMSQKYYKEILMPHLELYKNTVLTVLLEEESYVSLIELQKYLEGYQVYSTNIVIH